MGKVLVVGDVTLDWLELDVPRSEPKEEADLKNYQLCAGFRWTPVWGGAKLLERLVEAAIVEAEGELEMHQKTTIERIGLPEAGTDRSRCYLQSLAIIKSMIADKDKAIRVEKFKGFTKGVDKLAVAGVPTGIGAVDCLVLDDAANGCRWDDEFLKGVKEVGANARLVIVKLSRPLDSSSLVEALPKTDNGRRVVIIVNADDLRAQGVDISRRLSWERTALDVVSASRASPLLGRLTRHGDVMVRLGSDGCIVLMFDGGKHLTFDPRGAEGGF